MSSPPAIYRNLVITGSHVQEAPSLGPPGDVRAWDARTDNLVWTFHTLKEDEWKPEQAVDRSGLNVWGVGAARGMAFLRIGTPTTDFYGADRENRQGTLVRQNGRRRAINSDDLPR